MPASQLWYPEAEDKNRFFHAKSCMLVWWRTLDSLASRDVNQSVISYQSESLSELALKAVSALVVSWQLKISQDGGSSENEFVRLLAGRPFGGVQ